MPAAGVNTARGAAHAARARSFHKLLPDPGNAEEDGGPHSQKTVLQSASFKIERAGKVGSGVAGFDCGANKRGNDINHHAGDVGQGQVGQDALLLATVRPKRCHVMACADE